MAGEWGAPRKQVREAAEGGFAGNEERMRMMEARIARLEHGAFSEFVSFGLDGIKISGGGSLRVLDGGDVVVDPDGMVRSASFDGDLAAGEVGTTGWAMDDTAAALPNLLLRPGSVGNDILTNPILFDGGGGAITNFALSTTHTTLITVPKTVPEGCTKMASFSWGGVTAVNSRTVLDFVSAQVFIETFDGNPLWAPVDPNGNGGHTSASKYGILTSLTPGQTVTHGLRAWTSGGDWSAHVSSVADLQLLLLWGR